MGETQATPNCVLEACSNGGDDLWMFALIFVIEAMYLVGIGLGWYLSD